MNGEQSVAEMLDEAVSNASSRLVFNDSVTHPFQLRQPVVASCEIHQLADAGTLDTLG